MPLDRVDIPMVADEDEDAVERLPEPPIEPGNPSPENVLFVLLGVLAALAVIGRLVVLFG